MCPRVDMNFIFEWSTRYLTSSLRSLVRYRVDHEKIKFISISGHVIFCLLYKLTDDGVFDDFPKISDHFPKVFQNCSEGQTNVPEKFPRISENFRRCPRIPKDFRRFSRKTRRYFDDTPTNLSTI